MNSLVVEALAMCAGQFVLVTHQCVTPANEEDEQAFPGPDPGTRIRLLGYEVETETLAVRCLEAIREFYPESWILRLVTTYDLARANHRQRLAEAAARVSQARAIVERYPPHPGMQFCWVATMHLQPHDDGETA
jgi:hypothetical protein